MEKTRKKDHLYYLDASRTLVNSRWALIFFTLLAAFYGLCGASGSLVLIKPLFFICVAWAIGNLFISFHAVCLDRFASVRFGARGIRRLMTSLRQRKEVGRPLAALSLLYLYLLQVTHDFVGGLLSLRRLGILQVALDLVCMLGVIHFTGGIDSPFVWLLLVPLAGGAVVLPIKDTLYQLAATLIAMTCLFWAEKNGILTKTIFLPLANGDPTYLLGPAFFYQTAIFLLVGFFLVLLVSNLAVFYQGRTQAFVSTLKELSDNSHRYRYALQETDISVLVLDRDLRVLTNPIISSGAPIFSGKIMGREIFEIFSDLSREELEPELFLLTLNRPEGRSLKRTYHFPSGERQGILDLCFYLVEEGPNGRFYDLIIRDHTELSATRGKLAAETMRRQDLENTLEQGRRETRLALSAKEALEGELRAAREQIRSAEAAGEERLRELAREKDEAFTRLLDESRQAAETQLRFFQKEKFTLEAVCEEKIEKARLANRLEGINRENHERESLDRLAREAAEKEKKQVAETEKRIQAERETSARKLATLREEFERRLSTRESELTAALRSRKEELERAFAEQERALSREYLEREKQLAETTLHREKGLQLTLREREADLERLKKDLAERELALRQAAETEFQGGLQRRRLEADREKSARSAREADRVLRFQARLFLGREPGLEEFLAASIEQLKSETGATGVEWMLVRRDDSGECRQGGAAKIEKLLPDPKIRALICERRQAFAWGARKDLLVFPRALDEGSTLLLAFDFTHRDTVPEISDLEPFCEAILGLADLHFRFQAGRESTAAELLRLTAEIERRREFFDFLEQSRPPASPGGMAGFLALLKDRFGVRDFCLKFRDHAGQWRRLGDDLARLESAGEFREGLKRNSGVKTGRGEFKFFSEGESLENFCYLHNEGIRAIGMCRYRAEAPVASNPEGLKILFRLLIGALEIQNLVEKEKSWAQVLVAN